MDNDTRTEIEQALADVRKVIPPLQIKADAAGVIADTGERARALWIESERELSYYKGMEAGLQTLLEQCAKEPLTIDVEAWIVERDVAPAGVPAMAVASLRGLGRGTKAGKGKGRGRGKESL